MLDFELSDSYHQFFKNAFDASYLYGVSWCGHSQIPADAPDSCNHFVAVIANEIAFDTIRQEVVNFQASQALSHVSLYCIHQQNFDRFLAVNPSFANRLAENGWSSSSEAIQTKKSDVDLDNSGWIAWQTMQATADLYYDQSNNLRLRSLLPKDSENSSAEDPMPDHDGLKLLFDQFLPVADDYKHEPATPPPFDFPEPIAIYLKLDQLILVSHNPAEVLLVDDQSTLKSWMGQHAASAVQVCTPSQLRQAVESEDLVTSRLMSYQHIWGANVLVNIDYDKNKLLIGAAKVAAHWQFYGVSKLLFTVPISAENDRKIIHDLQNRLLNIRLQNELFSRFGYSDKGVPTIEIPDRSAPISHRLQVIQDLFAWWTSFYLDQVHVE